MNNGSKMNELALCSHIYDFIYKHRIDDYIVAEIYKNEIDREYMLKNLPAWRNNLSSYETIYYAESDINVFNSWLIKYRSPCLFTVLPRTGLAVIMRHLVSSDNAKLYVSNFSFFDETRISAYAKSNESFHSPKDELNILRWLHSEKHVDASLCMLDDTESVQIKATKKYKPTLDVLSLISDTFGEYNITT